MPTTDVFWPLFRPFISFEHIGSDPLRRKSGYSYFYEVVVLSCLVVVLSSTITEVKGGSLNLISRFKVSLLNLMKMAW